VVHATCRDGVDEWHVECRFSDGAKFAAVRVSYNGDNTALFLAEALPRCTAEPPPVALETVTSGGLTDYVVTAQASDGASVRVVVEGDLPALACRVTALLAARQLAGRVRLYVIAEGTAGDREDQGVPGVYGVEVDAGLDAGDRASAALDIFHENVAVGTLDSFTFSVADGDGNRLVEGDAKGYSLGHRGMFTGRVADADVPQEPSRMPGR